jgi:hypothetical protein
MTWIGVTILIFLAILNYAAPYLTRRDLLFGATIAPDFRESAAARNIFRRFWRVSLLFHVPAILIAVITSSEPGWLLAFLLTVTGNVFAYARAHKEMRSYAVAPSELRHAELLARRQSTAEHPLALALPVILLAAGFLSAFVIPDSSGHAPLFAGWSAIVARWMQIDAQADGPLSFALGAWCGSFAPILLFRFNTRFNPAGLTNYRRLILRNVIALNTGLALFCGWIMNRAALGHTVDRVDVRIALTVIIIGLATHLSYMLWLRRNENEQLALSSGQPLGDRTRDSDWLWGMFYHNPDDPALLVEARCGPGYTLNFGHVRAWAVLSAFITIMIVPLVLKK